MSACPPFAALWADAHQRLNLLTREEHFDDMPCVIDPHAREVERLLPQLAGFQPEPRDARWLFLLEPSLPADWLALPWERMTLGGQPLARQALIVRRAVWHKSTGAVLKPARFLNLFPVVEHPFANNLQGLVAADVMRPVQATYLQQDGAEISDLFILAHGNAQGLLDKNKQPFALPDWHPAPARVWLLACNVNGAMDRLATRLLARGCPTVIAAAGDLSAPQMESLIYSWARESPRLDPVTWLAGQSGDWGDGGMQALRIWGSVKLDGGSSRDWNQLAWEIRHRTREGMPLDDSITAEAFHRAHDAMKHAETWAVTRQEMAAPLLWLAEKTDHSAIAELERSVETRLGETPAPAALYALAASARRLGHYGAMARYLMRSLSCPDLSLPMQADALGQLANLFIDLDLPKAALRAIAYHQDLDIAEAELRRNAEFRRLDWQARAEARNGQFDIALLHLRTKQRLAIETMGNDGARELAGLLYLGAWGYRAGQVPGNTIEPFASEARQYLAGVQPKAIGAGNDNEKYLLRALAAWSWASADQANLGFVADWRDCAIERLAEHDPGPWAYVLLFLHAAGHAGTIERDCALESLVRAGYLLEASLLGAISRNEKATRWLQRFQQRRNQIIAGLKGTAWLDAVAIGNETAQRCADETKVPAEFQIAVQNGVLPL